ncbi:ubiquinol-cytochrome c reductase iron-sulfur subunit [Aurantimonas sp. 22II-16-19i]|uniref:ubiquinol-cytochrome c reductase iron-sulfur subunit n=1 Tax=Aurantimonas sp. 22II-16-19i TaxID=1317114 RepID=UPI0009F7C586|nr:ubiquinol-cytochrome c reductase iron-sulfur subunit [Aurantimonas sp. 22II-16-19i]MAU95597.1 ubiquinol-cytochrome c reductase iron-sulfur subunit [Fulvimarina sp.]ORE96876.1 ubiquinol-cytochrome C reductase IRON-sulfur subunit [Aurantimonas sp. 22II-16-19i]
MSVHDTAEPNRRDFLYIATGAVAAVGAAAAVWPFIDQMNPDAATLALAEIEVDVSQVAEGQSITAKWRGKPVFIRQRTAQEVEEAKGVALSDLKDPIARNANLPADAPATDINRVMGAGSPGGGADLPAGREQWLVMIGVCTHLGCIPNGQAGDYGGWFCPCHGSHYDTAGRIRFGPAPENMAIPPFEFTSDTVIRIG